MPEMPVIPFPRPLVLATASEARRALVRGAGLEFATQEVGIDESPLPGEGVAEYVERLAVAKAEAALPPSLDAVIVAVDTAIGVDGRIIGKPADADHANRIIRELSGRTHEVLSAIAVRDVARARVSSRAVRTEVEFIALSNEAVEWYVGTGEWRGRAGAYAIQGKGAALVASVRGCFTNVIGISLPALFEMLAEI
jgi:septum formation protein